MPLFLRAVVVTSFCSALALGAAGCADGNPVDAGMVRDTPLDSRTIDAPRDAPSVDVPIDDVMLVDAPGDTPPDCGSMTCTGLTHCVAGDCVDYPPCRGDGTCAAAGDICRNRRCIPGTDDPDGDGSPAADDCDETNPMRSPLLPEICNAMDDNCNGAADEGDPAMMCSLRDMSGICSAGMCLCPAGTFDFDRAVPGCECTGAPAAGTGAACASAVDLGTLNDDGGMQEVMGNALLGEAWYHFRAVDLPDTSCDNYHVRVQFTTNPGDAYEFTVARGACSTAECSDMALRDYRWATDYRADDGAGLLGGECPCTSGTSMTNVSPCSDNSADYYVRVRRVSGAPMACDPFVLQVSNGVFST